MAMTHKARFKAEHSAFKVERSAGAVIFRKEKKKRLYLLLLYGLGHIDFPKGHIEKGEKTLEAARREAREETGIKNLKFADGFKETIKYVYGLKGKKYLKFVAFFLAQTKTKKVRLSPEHRNYFWLPYARAYEKLTYGSAKKILVKAEKFLKKSGKTLLY